MDEFTIPPTVAEGLSVFRENRDQEFAKNVITKAVQAVLQESSPPDNASRAVAAVISLATKFSCDEPMLRDALQSISIPPVFTDELWTCYSLHEKELARNVMRFNDTVPLVTECEWTLSTDIKPSSPADELIYKIDLGSIKPNGSRQSVANFSCNTDEMVMLISKLKEIERHCEKYANAAK